MSEPLEPLEPLNNKKSIEQLEKLDIDEKSLQLTKPKKKLSPAQIATLEKGRAKAHANHRQKGKVNMEIEEEIRRRVEEERKLLEDKIIQKAINRKKKQIKQQVLLEQFSDDDTPIEKVKEIMKRGPKQNLPPRPEAPKYIFV